jgi:hypothetical protein
VTRMSNDQKQNIVLKNVEEERAKLEANKITSPSSSSSSEEESDSETGIWTAISPGLKFHCGHFGSCLFAAESHQYLPF